MTTPETGPLTSGPATDPDVERFKSIKLGKSWIDDAWKGVHGLPDPEYLDAGARGALERLSPEDFAAGYTLHKATIDLGVKSPSSLSEGAQDLLRRYNKAANEGWGDEMRVRQLKAEREVVPGVARVAQSVGNGLMDLGTTIAVDLPRVAFNIMGMGRTKKGVGDMLVESLNSKLGIEGTVRPDPGLYLEALTRKAAGSEQPIGDVYKDLQSAEMQRLGDRGMAQKVGEFAGKLSGNVGPLVFGKLASGITAAETGIGEAIADIGVVRAAKLWGAANAPWLASKLAYAAKLAVSPGGRFGVLKAVEGEQTGSERAVSFVTGTLSAVGATLIGKAATTLANGVIKGSPQFNEAFVRWYESAPEAAGMAPAKALSQFIDAGLPGVPGGVIHRAIASGFRSWGEGIGFSAMDAGWWHNIIGAYTAPTEAERRKKGSAALAEVIGNAIGAGILAAGGGKRWWENYEASAAEAALNAGRKSASERMSSAFGEAPKAAAPETGLVPVGEASPGGASTPPIAPSSPEQPQPSTPAGSGEPPPQGDVTQTYDRQAAVRRAFEAMSKPPEGATPESPSEPGPADEMLPVVAPDEAAAAKIALHGIGEPIADGQRLHYDGENPPVIYRWSEADGFQKRAALDPKVKWKRASKAEIASARRAAIPAPIPEQVVEADRVARALVERDDIPPETVKAAANALRAYATIHVADDPGIRAAQQLLSQAPPEQWQPAQFDAFNQLVIHGTTPKGQQVALNHFANPPASVAKDPGNNEEAWKFLDQEAYDRALKAPTPEWRKFSLRSMPIDEFIRISQRFQGEGESAQKTEDVQAVIDSGEKFDTPLQVVYVDGKVDDVDGLHRALLMKRAGVTHVPVIETRINASGESIDAGRGGGDYKAVQRPNSDKWAVAHKMGDAEALSGFYPTKEAAEADIGNVRNAIENPGAELNADKLPHLKVVPREGGGFAIQDESGNVTGKFRSEKRAQQALDARMAHLRATGGGESGKVHLGVAAAAIGAAAVALGAPIDPIAYGAAIALGGTFLYRNWAQPIAERLAYQGDPELAKPVQQNFAEVRQFFGDYMGRLEPLVHAVRKMANESFLTSEQKANRTATRSLQEVEWSDLSVGAARGKDAYGVSKALKYLDGWEPWGNLTLDEIKILNAVKAVRNETGRMAREVGLQGYDQSTGKVYNINFNEARDIMPRVYGEDGRDIFNNPGSKPWKVFRQAVMDLNGYTLAEAEQKMQIVARLAGFRRSQMEATRIIPKMPDYIRVDGEDLQVFETRPYEYSERLAESASRRIATVKVGGQEDPSRQESDVGDLSDVIGVKLASNATQAQIEARAAEKAYVEGSEDRQKALRALVQVRRAHAGIPIEQPGTLLGDLIPTPGKKIHRWIRAMNVIRSVWAVTKLPTAAAQNLVEAYASPSTFLGGARMLAADLTVKFMAGTFQWGKLTRLAEKYAKMGLIAEQPSVRLGGFGRKYTHAHRMIDIARQVSYVAFPNTVANWLNDIALAMAGEKLVKDLRAGKVSAWEKVEIGYTLDLLGYTPEQKDLFLDGNIPSPVLSEFLRRLRQDTMGVRGPEKQGLIQQMRASRFAWAFQSFSANNMRVWGKVIEGAAEAFHDPKLTVAQRASRINRFLRHLRGKGISVAAYATAWAFMAYGVNAMLAYAAPDEWGAVKNYARKMWQLFISQEVSGPVLSQAVQAEMQNKDVSVGDMVWQSTWFGSMLKSIGDAYYRTGPFAGRTAPGWFNVPGRLLEWVIDQTPALRYARTWSEDPELSIAIRRRYEVIPPRSDTGQSGDPTEFQKTMMRFITDFRAAGADPNRYSINELHAILWEAVNVPPEDVRALRRFEETPMDERISAGWKHVEASLRRRRVLDDLDDKEKWQLREQIGDKLYGRLEEYDLQIGRFADWAKSQR